MTEEHVPVTFADAHTFVHERHVSAPIVHWAARARAKEVDEELLFPHYAILSAMRPKAPELRIGAESWQEIISHCGDGVIPTKASSSCHSLCHPHRGSPSQVLGMDRQQ